MANDLTIAQDLNLGEVDSSSQNELQKPTEKST